MYLNFSFGEVYRQIYGRSEITFYAIEHVGVKLTPTSPNEKFEYSYALIVYLKFLRTRTWQRYFVYTRMYRTTISRVVEK